jgi:hypothetical protein
MREIRTSGSMRGGRKRAFAWRACLLLYRAPDPKNVLLPIVHASTCSCFDGLRQLRFRNAIAEQNRKAL